MKTSKWLVPVYALLLLASCGKNAQTEQIETFSQNEKTLLTESESIFTKIHNLQELVPFNVVTIKEFLPEEIVGFKQIQRINNQTKTFHYKDAKGQDIYVHLLDFAGKENAALYMHSDFLKRNRLAIVQEKDAIVRKTKSGNEVLCIPDEHTTDLISLVNDRFEIQMRASDIEIEKVMGFAENLLNSVKGLK